MIDRGTAREVAVTAQAGHLVQDANQEALYWQSATELARRIAAGEVSATEVVEAFIRRIETVNPRLNALVLPRFDEARREAARADEAQRRGAPLGPLHGVPITIKECFHLQGTPSSIGVDRFREEQLEADGPLVERLRRAGAIILGKTNVPQAMLLHETDNPIYGCTNNPWRLDRSPGGSSGGESALIAAGGSVLGLANDLGGSIRQPAHVCGICGIKPTAGRLTNLGCRNNISGLKLITTQAGFLARTTADLWRALEVIQPRSADEAAADEVVMPLGDPWQVDVRRLRVGYFEDDGFFTPSPAIRRAVREAADALRATGAAVVPFRPPDVRSAMALYFALIAADGARALTAVLKGGRVDWRIARLTAIGRVGQPWRTMLAGATQALGQRHAAFLLRSTGRRTPQEMEVLAQSLADCRQAFEQALNAERLDALLLPPHALVAPPHGATVDLPPAASYCFLANLLGVPAGVIPWTTVRPGEETDRPRSLQMAERAARRVELGSAGLPVGIQVITRHWREDIALALMQALERARDGQLPRST